MITITLATEDVLSEAIGIRLLREASPVLRAEPVRKQGSGYLRSRMKSWCEIARNVQPVLLLTDLDQTRCPSLLIRRWIGNNRRPDQLVFRVAVREVESWLLADHEGMQKLLGSTRPLPPNPDGVRDPKHCLLKLAREATREIREELVAPAGAVATQGLGYNARLTAFVHGHWSPARAAKRSASLARARTRLAALAQKLVDAG